MAKTSNASESPNRGPLVWGKRCWNVESFGSHSKRNKQNEYLVDCVGNRINKAIGNRGPDGLLDIPITWWKGVVSAKLRGTAADDTIVYVSEKVAIDKSVTFNW